MTLKALSLAVQNLKKEGLIISHEKVVPVNPSDKTEGEQGTAQREALFPKRQVQFVCDGCGAEREVEKEEYGVRVYKLCAKCGARGLRRVEGK